MNPALLYLVTGITSLIDIGINLTYSVLMGALTPVVGLLFVLPMRLSNMEDNEGIVDIIKKRMRRSNDSPFLLDFFAPAIEWVDEYGNTYEPGKTAFIIFVLSFIYAIPVGLQLIAKSFVTIPKTVEINYNFHEEHCGKSWYKQTAVATLWLGITIAFPILGVALLVAGPTGYFGYQYREKLQDFYREKFAKKTEAPESAAEPELISMEGGRKHTRVALPDPLDPGHYAAPILRDVPTDAPVAPPTEENLDELGGDAPAPQ